MPATYSILYSFRRCPYAIRARLALCYAELPYRVEEVNLAAKPAALLTLSPKGTVPVLVCGPHILLEESLDIMHWALQQSDPNAWYYGLPQSQQQSIDTLITQNDREFKPRLDRYKYAVRYPRYPQAHYREQAGSILQAWEQRLAHTAYLVGEAPSLADMALLPFVRQFAYVDKAWFDGACQAGSVYPSLGRWLHNLLDSALFRQVMKKPS